jgi:heme-degrading monooxygenase HmoA
MNTTDLYKVVLIFNLTKGSADEELRRSQEENSFPDLLSKQPGFVQMELVKVNDEKTLSIQTWKTEKYWWQALETVKQQQAATGTQSRENILVSREFLNGSVQVYKQGK